ncbi:hypothetical protein ACIGZJ_15740 [Kitasatospora sp. NPDC052868]|uniref:hypothetical protein n=1 Tax=Kitasatospora sp. NPDC052868 TaxID=3364060 RepID=UPI0037C7649B
MHPAAIAHRDATALQARCEVAGVRWTTDLDPQYENTAVIPDGRWQPAPDGYVERFTPGIFNRDSGLVELFRLPAAIDSRDALAGIVAGLGDPYPVTLGETSDPAEALTTHTAPDTGRRLGLHVDNHQKLPYAARETARRRLCVNLGPGTRYLLLADTDIKSVCRTIHERYDNRHPDTEDLRYFVILRRPLRVLRLRIEPGEGFLAPTAVLPYDESTEGQAEPSDTASWLGHWERGVFGPLV